MATLNATPLPNATPPQVRLDLATGNPNTAFSSILVRRNGVPIMDQPYVGGSTAIAFDLTAPFGVPLEYTADITAGGWTTMLTAAWTNLTGWTTTSGTASASGGVLTINGTISRTANWAGARRLEFTNADEWSFTSLRLGPLYLYFELGWVHVFWYSTTGERSTMLQLSPDLTVTADATGVVARSGTDTVSIAGAPTTTHPNQIRIAGSGVARPFTLSSGVDPTPESLAVDTQLDSDRAWLTHVVAPGLSLPFTGNRSDGIWADGVSASEKLSRAQRTMHEPIGRDKPIVVKSGPRTAYAWDLVLTAPTEVDEADIQAMLADQTELLLRTPPSIDWELEDGWYSVGDVPIRRKTSKSVYEPSQITLPMQPVDQPVLVQGSARTLATVATEAPTMGDLDNKYIGYTLQDLQVGI